MMPNKEYSMTAKQRRGGGSLDNELSGTSNIGQTYEMGRLIALSGELGSNITPDYLERLANRLDYPLSLTPAHQWTLDIQTSLANLHDDGYTYEQMADYIRNNRRL